MIFGGFTEMNPARIEVDKIYRAMSEMLGRNFPIACYADEFYYFPQVQAVERPWRVWDLFFPDVVSDCCRNLSFWIDDLQRIDAGEDHHLEIEIMTLLKIASTLREQLGDIELWRYQPTFILTLVCLGLAEALDSSVPEAANERAASLPEYIDSTCRNFSTVPVLFRDLGLEMVTDTIRYLTSLGEILPEVSRSLPALERFAHALRTVQTCESFVLPTEFVKRIYRYHINCQADTDEIGQELDEEIDNMRRMMNKEADRLLKHRAMVNRDDSLWKEAVRSVACPVVGNGGMTALYREEIDRLAQHCLDNGFVSAEMIDSCPVLLAPVPDHLSAIRTASSYSIPPGHPPKGGTFYLLNEETSGKQAQREYRMLCAHETYPGHHLLDSSRWNYLSPLIRVVEQPLFYEGWACFAENLMKVTGYFSDPASRLLLARRRFWRALRGKIDLRLHTGRIGLQKAAAVLTSSGMDKKRAFSIVRKYVLNPGYQVCYTIGLKRFMQLFDRFGQNNPSLFVKTALRYGEIGFGDLTSVFMRQNIEENFEK